MTDNEIFTHISRIYQVSTKPVIHEFLDTWVRAYLTEERLGQMVERAVAKVLATGVTVTLDKRS